MNNFLRWLKMGMVISGIVAELAPSISSEFTKREKKKLEVVKATPITKKELEVLQNKPQEHFEVLPEGSPKGEPNIT